MSTTPVSTPTPDPAPVSGKIFVKTDHLICEDGQPVDGFYQELQMRLLTEPLTASWRPGRPYIAAANVGMFCINDNPAIVPDVFVSMDVVNRSDPTTAEGKSYLFWEMGKPPEIVIEIVSNTEGEELTSKRRRYAEKFRVPYYVVWDPQERLNGDRLMIFILTGTKYEQTAHSWFPELGLGLLIWTGPYSHWPSDDWLRWYGADDQLLATGAEQQALASQERARAEEERARADQERARADKERTAAERERARAEKLSARLRALGMNPDEITEQ